MSAIRETHFQLAGQTSFYKGKVRDVYGINNDYLLMIACDRISAFDVILPEPIPFKGQVLNQIAAHFLNLTKHIVPNWYLSSPDPNVSIGLKCQPFLIEMVIRGYLSGHAWREYKAGKRMICGVQMPDRLKENDRFPEPIITPTRKATSGHDEDISRQEIIQDGLATEAEYTQLENYTRSLFEFGSNYALQQGLILVDTKYEFGIRNGVIYLMDEIHTPDSSRYFYADSYNDIQQLDQQQRQLSKEFVRQWLIEKGFQGLEDQSIPEMTPHFIDTITERYIELYEKVTGHVFQKADVSDPIQRMEKAILPELIALTANS